MTGLEALVAQAFGPGGALAQRHSGMRQREGQAVMALAVAEAIAAGEHLVVEAGTGVGKSFAYLVPLLLSGRRALLSTATQALQDQLFARDIPAVTAALGRPVCVALLKGRNSYVCLQRVEQARVQSPGDRRDPSVAAALEQIHRWALQSERGDLAELAGLDERSPLRSLVSSTQENCLGTPCPRKSMCHVDRARAAASQAEWVVVNHHLLLTDQMAQRKDMAALLPPVDVVLVDEAHRLHGTASQLLGRSIGSAPLIALAEEVANTGTQRARGMQPWAHLALCLRQALGRVDRLCEQPLAEPARRGWVGSTPEGVSPAEWSAAARAVATALQAMRLALASTAGAAIELAHLHAEVAAMLTTWTELNQAAGQVGEVRWLEWTRAREGVSWRVVGAPAEHGRWFRERLVGPGRQGATWVFTSATLGNDESLRWFRQRIGLGDQPGVRVLRVPSPYDMARQAALYVPSDLPDPGDAEHTPALAEAVARWATQLGGRTLVLTTTLRAAHRTAAHLRIMVEQGRCGELEVLDAARYSKPALLARFRAASTAQPPRAAVLVASMGFWEGVDLPGEALQLLVLDKLPFPPPDDPLIKARAQASEARGESAFDGVHLPECVQALQQGAGRLIRSEADRGVLLIADRRLLTRSYGERLLAALPAMPRLVDEADMAAALEGLLTRPSTKGLLPT